VPPHHLLLRLSFGHNTSLLFLPIIVDIIFVSGAAVERDAFLVLLKPFPRTHHPDPSSSWGWGDRHTTTTTTTTTASTRFPAG
jgi:hypothetical protein